MAIPVRLAYRNSDPSEAVSAAIQNKVDKLEQFYDRIVSCRVVVSSPHRHQSKGKIFHIGIRLGLPGKELIVSHEPEKDGAHEDVYVAIRDSFKALEKQLEHHVEAIRRQVKHKETRPIGKIARIFHDRGYGFVKTPDDREVYFHENSVVNGDFEKLKIGSEVYFSEELGVKGPQASSMGLRKRQNGHLKSES